MTRRQAFRDPTVKRAFSADPGLLEAVMRATLPESEADVVRRRFGLIDGEMLTLDEIGQVYRINTTQVRTLLRQAISKLRNSKWSKSRLEELRGQDFLEILAARLDYLRDNEKRVFCDTHGWSAAYSAFSRGHRNCLSCLCFVSLKSTGRPAQYCSNACRQAAYRQRKHRATNEG